jgi:hypothetical protein
MKYAYLFFTLLIFTNSVFGQRTKLKQTSLWFRYSNNLSLPKEVKLKSELEHRLFVAPKVRTNQFYLRLTTEKHFKKNWYVGGGFVFFMNGANDARNESKLLAPEPRPFIDIGYRQKISDKFSITHRYRSEWRFFKNTNQAYTELEDGYRDNFRFRYQLMLDYMPFKKGEKELRLRAFNEVMINAGKNIARNIFDQNRTSFGMQYNINKYIGVEATYIYWIQQQGNGDSFISRHVVRFGLINNFTIKKKKKEEAEKTVS